MIPMLAHRRWRRVIGLHVAKARYWVSVVWRVRRLGASRRDRARIVALGLLLPVRDRWVPRERWRALRFELSYGGRGIPWTTLSSSDLEVLDEVLVQREYSVPELADVGTILDLGSHVGASLMFFRSAAPRARIVGVEPDRRTFALLERNVAQLENVDVCHMAIAAVDDDVAFRLSDQAWESRLASDGSDRVPGRRLDGFLAERNITQVDLLKIDIEGAEDDVIRDFAGLPRIGTVLGEYHGDAEAADAFFGLFEDFDVDVRGSPGQYLFHARNRATPTPSHEL